MAYRLGYEYTYTGTSGAPMSLGDTFDFDQLRMLSDGFGQTYTTVYLNAGSVNDPAPTNLFFSNADTFYLDGGTIGATGTAYSLHAELNVADIRVKFYAPLDPAADADGMIIGEMRIAHLRLIDPLNPTDIREFALITDIGAGRFLFYDYPPVSATVITTPSSSASWNINRVLDDQNFTYQQAGVPAVCFAKGTRIETIEGPRKIEDLSCGDLVKSKDGGWQPIVWVGSRIVRGHGKFAPIVIEAGAHGNRDRLVVSKQHRILLSDPMCDLYFGSPEALVAAQHLCNGKTVREVAVDQVEYFHILVDGHHLIMAEGLWAESMLLTEHSFYGSSDAGREELRALFPDLFDRMKSQITCRPSLTKTEARMVCLA